MGPYKYKGVVFNISEGARNYRVTTWYAKFKGECSIGYFPTIAKCKEYARKFVNEGGWDNWCN